MPQKEKRMLWKSKGLLTSKRAIVMAIAALTASQLALPATAQAQGLPLIRDTEIEALLSDYARPIFRTAGLGSGRVTVRIVRNDAFNAFVLDGSNVFMHTGSLMQAKTPNEVIGVIAHETGHIAGGHMAALRTRIAKDQTRALLTQILGIGAMIAGGVAGGDSGREALQGGQAVMQGGQDVIMRGLLSERRSQESAADQAGLKYLNATKQSWQGMLTTFERFQQQEYVSDQYKDPFVRSHPVATDRLARLRDLVSSSPYANQLDDPALQLRHDLMRAKLAGYLERPGTVFNLSAERHIAAGALRTRDRPLFPRRQRRARSVSRADRRSDKGQPIEPVLLGSQRRCADALG